MEKEMVKYKKKENKEKTHYIYFYSFFFVIFIKLACYSNKAILTVAVIIYETSLLIIYPQQGTLPF